jgi:hypothetical protein
MNKLMSWSVAAVAVAGLVGVGLVHADNPPGTPGPSQAAASESRLNDEQLSALIKGLGYTEKTSKSSDGKVTYHSLDFTVVNFRYIIDISLQEQGTAVYFSSPLKRIGEPEKVPAEKLFALLSKNDDITPMFFSYDASGKQLYLNYQIDNRDLTSARMMTALDRLKHVLSSTAPLWDTSKWPGGPQPAATQDAKSQTTSK